MPDVDIKYESDASKVTVSSIRAKIQSKLESKKEEYDSILGAFSNSECMQATAVRTMIEEEKKVVDVLIAFYMESLLAIENAGQDIDETEKTFSVSHLEVK